MNNIKFSIVEQAFYDDSYHTLPEDAVDISDDEHMRLVNGMNDGERRVIVDNGILTLSERKPSPLYEWDGKSWIIDSDVQYAADIASAEQKKAQLLANAVEEIAWRKYAVDKEIATTEEVTELDEWEMYRVLLMRVDTSKPEWPQPPET